MQFPFMTLKRTAGTAAVVVALAFAGAPLAYAVKNTGAEYNTLYAGLGAKGYDVMAYFLDGKPEIGSDKYTVQYGGVTWQFANREHRDTFAANPARYSPQYGGFCSWGVSQGKLFDVDPVNGWKVVDGKLYLNFNADIQKVWEKDSSGYITKAERNWPGLNH